MSDRYFQLMIENQQAIDELTSRQYINLMLFCKISMICWTLWNHIADPRLQTTGLEHPIKFNRLYLPQIENPRDTVVNSVFMKLKVIKVTKLILASQGVFKWLLALQLLYIYIEGRGKSTQQVGYYSFDVPSDYYQAFKTNRHSCVTG